MAWFTSANLKSLYPYEKVDNASDSYVDQVLIPSVQDFINSYCNQTWTDSTVPADVKRVAQNYAVARILGDDETVRIAQARGQPSYTVAGDTITLDLSPGRNPFLTEQDRAILEVHKIDTTRTIHTDKIVVRTQGDAYDEAPGGAGTPRGGDYVRGDIGNRTPGYIGSGEGPARRVAR